MPLSDWESLLVPATATKRTVDENPDSPTYGDMTDAGTFPVGYQKLSSGEVQDRGKEYGTELYMIIADLDSSGNAPVSKAQRVSISGVGELDVVSVVEYRQPDERIVLLEGEVSS